MSVPGASQTGAGEGGKRFPCSGCGADMEWDPKSGAMRCPYCGQVTQIAAPVAAGIAEHPIEAYLDAGSAALARMSAAALQATCSGCGSTVAFEPPEVAGSCPFCGARIVAQPVAADPLIAPDGVLPFAVARKDALARIQQWLSSRWFAPDALKKMARQDGIGGVYLPFWTYDADTRTRYTGQRGEHYWETEHYTENDAEGRPVHKTRQVQKTRWYPASGTVTRFFDDVLVPGTHAVDNARLNALEPWDLEDAVPYRPEFLSGFKAQRYQVELGEGLETAKQVMESVIVGDIRQDIGGDEQRIHGFDTDYRAVAFKHLLLPVWIAAYRFEGKVYQVAVNARTGEVSGERPYSVWKIAFLVLAILAVAAAIFLFNQNR